MPNNNRRIHRRTHRRPRLAHLGLIDELHFFINPIMIGKGLRISDLLEERQKFTLFNATPFDGGISVVSFKIDQK